MASDTTDHSSMTLEQSVQKALRDIGTTDSSRAADGLARTAAGATGISIHLRRAGIDAKGAVLVANALLAVSEAERARLRSFSLSYNAIGDSGAVALAAALPDTLGELGLVGCALGDEGGEAILDWARTASGLRMICIEGNDLSGAMRRRAMDLRKVSPQMAVFV